MVCPPVASEIAILTDVHIWFLLFATCIKASWPLIALMEAHNASRSSTTLITSVVAYILLLEFVSWSMNLTGERPLFLLPLTSPRIHRFPVPSRWITWQKKLIIQVLILNMVDLGPVTNGEAGCPLLHGQLIMSHLLSWSRYFSLNKSKSLPFPFTSKTHRVEKGVQTAKPRIFLSVCFSVMVA